MKRVLLVFLALALLAGCKKAEEPYVEGFTYSGCTKSESEIIDLSLLSLDYEGGDLKVTRTDAWMNCSFQNRGLVCTVSVQGSDIYYRVDYEKEGAEVKCVCLVESMSSWVKGLQEGKKYAFHYYCCQNYLPFSFTFKDDLILVQDVSTLLP
ncbi:MAG: hypothetical protein II454_07340 [Bacteroidales bacterium]|nr:hypothetical protein [Bacteroidales bacterium]